MKIAVYGVSAAGKDHLIDELVKYLGERDIRLTHVHGSATLNDLAMLRHGQPFSSLDETKKAELRFVFADELRTKECEYGNVVVDGHFAFYAEDGTFDDVFTDADLASYDLFFYLDTDPVTVSQRSEIRGNPIDVEMVSAWQEHEIEGLEVRLLEAGKELHIIRNDGEPTLNYVYEVLDGKWSSQAIAREAVERLSNLVSLGIVCLVDCDKTLVEEDTTSLVLDKHASNADGLINIYQRDRYTNYQSYMAERWLNENLELNAGDIEWACDTITLNKGLFASLANRPSVPVVAVTAGSTAIWSPLLERFGIGVELLDTNDVMSKYIKYFVTKELQRRGFFVIAIGDSMLDSLMLKHADRSYIYAGKGKRQSIANLLRSSPQIRQFSFCGYQYPGTYADESICWVDCLNQKDPEVASNIAICKSSSGFMGKALRNAHHHLGILLGKRISMCFEEELAVVIMMRSGLPLGEGIADELDCPILFYCDNVDKLIEQINDDGLRNKRIILVDGVVNTGQSLAGLADNLKGHRLAVATSVVSSTARLSTNHPVFSARVSDNSYVGAKQWDISGGKGPDTADRLFRTM